jgi:dienelactone hydrolase
MADLSDFLRDQAKKLREKDEPPRTRADWEKRRAALRSKMFTAIGEFPTKACELEPRIIGRLKRDGYTIEKLVLQSRPNVWVTTTAYIPEAKEKVPAVLVVHGHWPWARRDPVVQSRCVGLSKLGFLVLAVDAFGAGERFTTPGKGTYHGALYGSTLWPVGQTLLGMQVYDNRRAVDYILGRPEVNGKVGVTGASGGGNQTMYVGALDERILAAVPVCSVGNYQAYMKAACCVCELVPGALQFTEEGDVLGLTAPRALLVVNATKDGIQFSPVEAAKSVERARHIYKLLDAEVKVQHKIFESPHDYNQAMREAMYGWMALHLKGEGKGEPIPEPKLTIERTDDLACFPDPKDRPKGFYFPPTYAYAVGKELVARADKQVPDHPEMWEATAIGMRSDLEKLIGPLPELPNDLGKKGLTSIANMISETDFEIKPADGIVLKGFTRSREAANKGIQCLFVRIDGPVPIIRSFDVGGFLDSAHERHFCELRGTGQARSANDGIAGAPDHNSAERSLWIGSPLLRQWVVDIRAIATFIHNPKVPLVLIGMGALAVPSVIAASLFPDLIQSIVLIDPPDSYLSETAYAPGTPMGILAPGILKVGDIPHLAGLIAPRRLVIAGGTTLNGKKLNDKALQEAFVFTKQVYKATKSAEKLTITTEMKWEKIEL